VGSLSDKLQIASCGIGWVRLGEPPDPPHFRGREKQGILIDHRAQQFNEIFFEEYDEILAVSEEIAEQLKLRAFLPEYQLKIKLVTQYSTQFQGQEIPDPYYLSPSGFDDVMEIILDSCQGLLKHLFPL
jgi:protein-tyrosine phosphatase